MVRDILSDFLVLAVFTDNGNRCGERAVGGMCQDAHAGVDFAVFGVSGGESRENSEQGFNRCGDFAETVVQVAFVLLFVFFVGCIYLTAVRQLFSQAQITLQEHK
jgi:hypothetical protein